jgi:chemotaxis protein methyltransferase CheR
LILEPAQVERFRAVVADRMGLAFESGKLELLSQVLTERLGAFDKSRPDSYLLKLEHGWREEVRALAERLTVGETYFFRYADHFRAFVEVVLPNRVSARAGQHCLRILSAGCASGEEAYSLAILARENLPDPASWDVRLTGIDISASMIRKAKEGRYSAWSLRDTPAEMRAQHFQVCGRDYEPEPAVRPWIAFEERNLVEDDPSFWLPETYDVVFCRNVTMYFTPQVTRAVVARITRALVPGGFLFLGHAETLRGVSHDYHLCHTHSSFYYQRRDAIQPVHAGLDDAPDDHGPRPWPTTSTRPSMSVALGLQDSSWVTVIQQASDRIAKLVSEPRQPSQPRVAVADGADAPDSSYRALPSWDLAPALELLQRERFADAMTFMRALPVASGADRDAQLLRAVLLTNSGQLDEAEQVCTQILAADELDAGAHYLMALCREHAGDRTAALEHDLAATYLDPGFAMPHMHRGLLARRIGDDARARGELSLALSLLAREDASRILLFGGGFSREALAELCRSELRSCGGGP